MTVSSAADLLSVLAILFRPKVVVLVVAVKMVEKNDAWKVLSHLNLGEHHFDINLDHLLV